MSNPLYPPYDFKTYEAGANTDRRAEIVARTAGTYRDAHNMRLSDDDGNDDALSKISGEEIEHPQNVPGADTYVCVGAIWVKGKKFEVWASSQPDLYPPFILSLIHI